jgi:hypothetical protein
MFLEDLMMIEITAEVLENVSVDVRFNINTKRVLMLGESAATLRVEMNLKVHFYGYYNLYLSKKMGT